MKANPFRGSSFVENGLSRLIQAPYGATHSPRSACFCFKGIINIKLNTV